MLAAPRSPWQRAYVERVIGTIRRECLDHVIVCRDVGLSHHMGRFADYYLSSESHAPALREGHARVTPVHAPETGRILAIPEVGGFIIGTNVAPPESRTDVELCHSQTFSMRFVRGAFLRHGRCRSQRLN